MVKKVFEAILADPQKMAFYKQNPLLEASFMSLYAYKKAGHNFDDLPWFILSKNSSKIKRAA